MHAIQDACSLVPLSAYGKPYAPPPGTVDPSVDMKTAVRDQVNALDAVAYFTLLADLMKTNPPAPADKPMLETLARIGIVPGQDFDRSKFDVDFARRVPEVGFDRIMLHFRFQRRRSEGRERLGLYLEGRRLRNGLRAARPRDGHWSRRQSSSRRDLSDVAPRRRGRQLRRRQGMSSDSPKG